MKNNGYGAYLLQLLRGKGVLSGVGIAGVPVMKVIPASVEGVLILEPQVFGDQRGFFLESYNEKDHGEKPASTNILFRTTTRFRRNVLRGLHYQVQRPQGKLVRVVAGEILDVIVGPAPLVRRPLANGSGRALGRKQAHVVDSSRVCSWFSRVVRWRSLTLQSHDFYCPEAERTILWNDPRLAINWELNDEPVISAKDSAGTTFNQAELFP